MGFARIFILKDQTAKNRVGAKNLSGTRDKRADDNNVNKGVGGVIWKMKYCADSRPWNSSEGFSHDAIFLWLRN